jgi:hypothetical protein
MIGLRYKTIMRFLKIKEMPVKSRLSTKADYKIASDRITFRF